MSRTLKRGQDPRDPYTPTRQRVGSQGVPPTSRPTPRFVHDEPVGVPTCPYCGNVEVLITMGDENGPLHCAHCFMWRGR